jgi:diguanylate cyclase
MRRIKRILKLAKRHTAALIGMVLALFALWIQFFDPLDLALSVFRDKLRLHDASGQIVIVTLPEPAADNALETATFENKLRRIIETAKAQGAERIAIREPVTSSIRDWSALDLASPDRAAHVGFGFDAEQAEYDNAPVERGQHARLIDHQLIDYWGGVRHVTMGTATDDRVLPSIESFLAGETAGAIHSVAIDYSIKAASLKTVAAAELLSSPGTEISLASKRILIDFARPGDGDAMRILGQGRVSPATVTALGAETLMAGERLDIGPLPFFLFGWMLIYALKRMRRLGLRLAGSIAVVPALIVAPSLLEALRIDLHIADGLIVFLIGTVWCLTSDLFRQNRVRHERNAVTGFFTSSALRIKSNLGQSLIVVHIHNYLEIVSKHAEDSERDFARRIAERLLPGQLDDVYQGDDGYFFWSVSETDNNALDAHLRAIAVFLRNGVPFENRAVSLVVSFGVDQRREAPAFARSAGAMSASLEAFENGLDWHLFSQEGEQRVEEDAALAADLRQACASGDIDIALQPKLDVRFGTIDGYEALARWTHPVLGPVSPGRFIPLAERYGIIEDLTFTVMRKAWAAHRRLTEQGVALRGAVNISPLLLSTADSANRVLAALDGSGVDPEQLIVEITESSSLASIDEGRRFIEQVRQRGIKVSMDDFGTGQSSLALLRDLTFDEIKVDRQFALHAMVDDRDRAFLETTIMLAQRLGIACVVEGIEDQAGIRFVSALGGDYVQGYAVAKPMLESEFQHFLTDWLARPGHLKIA